MIINILREFLCLAALIIKRKVLQNVILYFGLRYTVDIEETDLFKNS